ncbi:hypothetical protein M9Y10_002745 [Tritrichomonas musculus]|uniref:Sm protein B n=1 Tax=Tritrichomonas musculus TaxID=1915356 RepID=A0ABR2LAM3_9EUKA
MEANQALLTRLLNGTVDVKLSDTNYFHGILIGYDKHLNIVLKDCDEIQIIDGQTYQEHRGLMIIRGINVKLVHADQLPPPPIQNKKSTLIQTGVGTVKPFTRGYD